MRKAKKTKIEGINIEGIEKKVGIKEKKEFRYIDNLYTNEKALV